MQRILEPEVMDTVEEAREYDAMDHSGPNNAFVQRLIELGAQGVMLDVGTGPGHIPLLVCEKIPGARVFGIDLSRNMLKIAEQHRMRSPNRNRIIYQLADAKKIDFQERNFDVVYSNTILHHIPDPRPFLKECRRVLRVRGVLLIRDLMRPASAEIAREQADRIAAGATQKQRDLLCASYCASFTPDELRALAKESGLESAEVVEDDATHMSLQLRAG